RLGPADRGRMVATAVCRLRNWTRLCQGRCCRSLSRSSNGWSASAPYRVRRSFVRFELKYYEGNTLRVRLATQKNRHVGRPTQPVSRFAPLEALAIRTTCGLGAHSI